MVSIFILTVLRRVSTFFIPILVIPLIGLEGYGEIVDIMVWGALITSVLVLGQNVTLFNIQSETVMSQHIIAYLGMLFIVIVVPLILFSHYITSDLTYKVLLGVTMVAYMLFQTKCRYCEKQIKSLIGGALVQPLILVIGLFLFQRFEYFIPIVILASWVIPTLLIIEIKPASFSKRPKLNMSAVFLLHSFKTFITSMIDFLLLRLDFLIISLLFSTHELAIYALASNFALLILQPQAILSFIGEPKIAKHGRRWLNSQEKLRFKNINILLSAVGVIIFGILGKYIIALITGNDGIAYVHEIYVVSLVLMFFYFLASCVGGLYPSILNLIHSGKSYNILSACLAILAYILAFIGFYLFYKIDLTTVAICVGLSQFVRLSSSKYFVVFR
jgi:O-antigen/teichoic acid export membrane protein